MQAGEKMSTLSIILIAALGGSLVTGGTIWGIQAKNANSAQANVEIIEAIAGIKSDLAEAQLVTAVNLTDTDLLEVPCSAEYIKEHKSDLLCREMFCRLQSRGLDSAAAQSECEEIANLQNSLIILDACDGRDSGAYQACLQVFTTRK
jgi:hypothetical protein